MCKCTCVEEAGGHPWMSFLWCHVPYFLRQNLTGLVLTKTTRVHNQKAPGSHLSWLPRAWIFTCAPSYPFSKKWVPRKQTWVCKPSSLPPGSSPRTVNYNSVHLGFYRALCNERKEALNKCAYITNDLIQTKVSTASWTTSHSLL